MHDYGQKKKEANTISPVITTKCRFVFHVLLKPYIGDRVLLKDVIFALIDSRSVSIAKP